MRTDVQVIAISSSGTFARNRPVKKLFARKQRLKFATSVFATMIARSCTFFDPICNHYSEADLCEHLFDVVLDTFFASTAYKRRSSNSLIWSRAVHRALKLVTPWRAKCQILLDMSPTPTDIARYFNHRSEADMSEYVVAVVQ